MAALDLHSITGNLPIVGGAPEDVDTNSGSFIDVLYRELVAAEGLGSTRGGRPFEVYYDGLGLPTIGVGWNLHSSVVRNFVFRELGLVANNDKLSSSEQKKESDYINQINALINPTVINGNDLDLENKIQAVMTARSNQPYFSKLDIQRTKFGWDSEADVKTSLVKYLQSSSTASGPLTGPLVGSSSELVALYSMYHNAPALLVDRI